VIRRRTLAAGIMPYLRNGGRREFAQKMAAHELPGTAAVYDPGDDEMAVDELERIVIENAKRAFHI
jgi:integrase/recombinase XerD